MNSQVEESRVFSDFFVRQADLDDTEALQKLVTEGARNELDQLFRFAQNCKGFAPEHVSRKFSN